MDKPDNTTPAPYSPEELQNMASKLWGWGNQEFDPTWEWPWTIDPDSPEAMVTGGGGHSDPLTGAWIPDDLLPAVADTTTTTPPPVVTQPPTPPQTPTPPPGFPAYDAWGNPYGSPLYTVALDAPFDPDNGA